MIQKNFGGECRIIEGSLVVIDITNIPTVVAGVNSGGIGNKIIWFIVFFFSRHSV